MLKLTVLLVSVAAVWGLPKPDKPSFKKLGRPTPNGRIVGGHDADIAEYPYMLVLAWHKQPTGGAALIGSKWALTAAHCTHAEYAEELQVIAGTTDLKGGQMIQVAAIYEHPKFDVPHGDYDAAVLELAEDVTIENSTPIALHDSGYTAPEGTAITITGWGYLNESTSSPDVLQVVVTKVVSNEVCNEAYKGKITDRMMCAGNFEEGGEGVCYYDDGGPLVVDGKLYGAISWGHGCARAGYPGINSKFSEPTIREFIRNITGL